MPRMLARSAAMVRCEPRPGLRRAAVTNRWTQSPPGTPEETVSASTARREGALSGIISVFTTPLSYTRSPWMRARQSARGECSGGPPGIRWISPSAVRTRAAPTPPKNGSTRLLLVLRRLWVLAGIPLGNGHESFDASGLVLAPRKKDLCRFCVVGEAIAAD